MVEGRMVEGRMVEGRRVECVVRRRRWLIGVGTSLIVAGCERTRAPADAGAANGGARRSSAPSFERVARLESNIGTPEQVVLGARGHVLVVASEGHAIVQRGQARTHRRESGTRVVAARDGNGFVIGLTPLSSAGAAGKEFRTGGMLDGDGRRQLALAEVGGEWITVVQSGTREVDGMDARRQPPAGPARWRFRVEGNGAAAIAPGGRVVMAAWDGRVVMLGDVAKDRLPEVLADVRIEPPPFAVACADDGVSLLVAPPIVDHDDGGLRISPRPGWQPQRAWTSTLVELGFDGRERWRVELPFAALHALRRGDGSVIVAGMGVARVVDGETTWSRTSADRVHVADAGTELVVAHGTTIERVDDDGRTRASTSIDDGPIVCPPAVGPDGAIWVATANGVWRVA